MGWLNWLKGRLSVRQNALEHYRRGMTRANQHDSVGAIADYTTAIETTAVPSNIKAMALYNRALVYSSLNQDEAAIRDLDNVLKMSAAPNEVRTEAQRRLVRMQRAVEHQNRQAPLGENVAPGKSQTADSHNHPE